MLWRGEERRGEFWCGRFMGSKVRGMGESHACIEGDHRE